MGCGCCITTFRDEVEGEVFSYINRLNKHDRTKKNLIQEIQRDLNKRAETVERYNYPYRHDDVEKTVKIYKNYIFRKFKGDVELLEDKIKPKEKEGEVKNIKKDDNKLKLKGEEKNKKINEIEKNNIVDKEEKKLSNNNEEKREENKESKVNNSKEEKNKEENKDSKINNSKEEKKKEENKDSMANNRNEEKLESILKSDLHPMLEDKIKNYSERDDSKEQKEKSIDNIQQYLPKREDEQNKYESMGNDKRIDNNDNEEEVRNSLRKENE